MVLDEDSIGLVQEMMKVDDNAPGISLYDWRRQPEWT